MSVFIHPERSSEQSWRFLTWDAVMWKAPGKPMQTSMPYALRSSPNLRIQSLPVMAPPLLGAMAPGLVTTTFPKSIWLKTVHIFLSNHISKVISWEMS